MWTWPVWARLRPGAVDGLWRAGGSLSGEAVGRSAAGLICTLVTEVREQLLHSLAGAVVGGQARRGAAAGVQHRRVVAATELPPDRGQRGVRELAREVHGELAGPGDSWRAGAREELLGGKAEVLAGGLLDLGDRAAAGLAGTGGARVEAARTSRARSVVSGRPVSELKATTRISAPSRARTLLSTCSAIADRAVSSAGSMPSWCARLRRIARRVGRSGGWMSATRPASKRSRRRSSSACRSRGGRSEVRTTWRPPSCRALKVWKNSSSVRVLRSRNWTSSTSSTSTSRKRRLKISVLRSPSAPRNSLVKASPVVRADGQRRVVADEQVGDRAEQVGLADAGGPADEQRVVGLRRHLGDGQRSGVGEPVGVADHELVEGQLRVAERSAWAGECALRSCGRSRGDGPRAARTTLAGGVGARRAELDARVRAEH